MMIDEMQCWSPEFRVSRWRRLVRVLTGFYRG